MPLGETIGAAYVRILADGSGFAEDVKRQMKDADPDMKAAGRNTSKAYQEGFKEETDKWSKKSNKKLLDDLNRSVGKFHGQGQLAGSEYMKGLQDFLEKKFPKGLGTEIFRDLNQQIKEGKLDFTGLEKQLQNLRPMVVRATKAIQAEQAANAKQAVADQERLAREIIAIQRRTQAEEERLRKQTRADEEKLARDILAIQRRSKAEQEKLGAEINAIRRRASKESSDQLGQDLTALEGKVKKLDEQFFKGGGRKKFRNDLVDLKDRLPSIEGATGRFGKRIEGLEKVLTPSGNRLERWGNTLEKVAAKTGKLFGKGSRNNFLNFFGGFMSIVPAAGAAATKFVQGIGDKFGELKGIYNDAGRGIKGFGSVLASIGSEGLPGLVVAAVALEGFQALLGPLGAGIALVSGLILALAGSLGFALVGALVAVGGALVPFAAAFGVAALAMSNLDKKSSFFKKLQSDWKGLQKTVQGEIFGKKQQGLENIHKLLKGIMPLITPIAHALGQLLDQVGKVASSKGFAGAMKSIGDAIAPMIGTLGGIFGNLGKALGEAFLIATPMIQEFLGWVSGVAQALADSGKGGAKSPMADFLNRAWDSAKKVLSVVDKLIKIIGTLLDAGKDTGDSIFQKIADWLQKGLDKLQEWKKDGTLKKFFDDAGRLGDKLGDVVNAVGDLLDALDTPTNRTMFIDLIGLVADLINAITWVVKAVDSMNGAFAKWAFMTGQNIDKVVGWYLSLPGKVRAIPGQIAGFFSGMADKIIAGAGDLATSFGTWIAGIASAIPGLIGQITGFFSGLADKIFTGAGNIAFSFATWLANLPIAVLNAVDSIVLGFAGLAGKIITGAGDLTVAFINWTLGLAGAAAQAAVNIVFGFANLAVRIFNAAGSLATAFGAWLQTVPGKLKAFVASLPGFFRGLPGKIISAAGSIASAFGNWIQSLPGKARAIAGQVMSAFGGLAAKAIARAGSILGALGSWLAGLPGKARSIVQQIQNAFSGLASKAIAKAGSIVAAMGHWASGVGARASQVANDIVNAFRGLAGKIVDAIGNIVPRIKMPSIQIPHITAIVDKPKAAGGVFTSPRMALFAEAGPEAVVPLNRPLSQVDPAVRMLSAIAQGKMQFGGGGGRPGKTIDIGGITINTPTENPRAVASEVVAHMAAAAYI